MIKQMTSDEKAHAEKIEQRLTAFTKSTSARNPLVAALEGLVKLVPYPGCATCPVAFWFFDDQLRCFCKVRKEPTWGGMAKPVRGCAEREDQLNEQRSRA